jgi:hypothetical protein
VTTSLPRYLRTHGYEWAGATRARNRSLIDESHSTSPRATVACDEHLILTACRCACSRSAIDTDDSKRIFTGRTGGRRSGRTGLAFFASRTGWSRRPWLPFFAGRARWTRVSLWPLGTLAAARQAKGECNYESKARRPHARILNSHDPPRIYISRTVIAATSSGAY